MPRTHKQDLFLKLNSLTQGSMSVEKYIKEFEHLYTACDCRDQEEQKIAKFMLGLSKNLRNYVELQPLTTFDEVYSFSCKLERQHKGLTLDMRRTLLIHPRRVLA